MSDQTSQPTVATFSVEKGFPLHTRRDLWRARLLFAALLVPGLARTGALFLMLALRLRLPFVTRLLRPTLFAQFCGGETTDSARDTLAALRRHRVGAILDYVAERGKNESDFAASHAAILETISDLDTECPAVMAVFKPTAIIPTDLLESVSRELASIPDTTVLPPPNELHSLNDRDKRLWCQALERVDALCAASARQGASLMIDAEESWLQPAIDAIAISMMRKYNRNRATVFNTIQFYRTGRVAFLETLLKDAQLKQYILGIKAVRGAYLEKERARSARLGLASPVHANKADTDSHFDRGVQLALSHPEQIHLCVATHNTASALLAANETLRKNSSAHRRHLCFSQLFGMCDYLSFNLAHQGFSVVKYLPYGPILEAVPYLLRRAEENASVQGQAGDELRWIGLALKSGQAG